MEPTISIIVPVYKVELYIGDCIRSILAQNYKKIEVIIVDDCTPDKSIDIVKSIISKVETDIEFKFVYHKINKGVSAARNSGIQVASGEYLMFVDSDDKLPADICSVLSRRLMNSKYDIIIGNRDIISPKGEPLHQSSTRIKYEVEMTTISDYNKYNFQGEVYNKIIRKEFLLKNNLFFKENIVFEDTLWVSQIKCYSPKILYIPVVTYIYCLREGSTMTTYTIKHLRSQIECAKHAHIFASTTKTPNRWFAYYSAYQFRKAALLYSLVRTEKPIRSFFALYHKFKNAYPLDTHYNLILNHLSFIQKVRFYSNRLPFVNCLIELMFIWFKANQMDLQTGKDIKLELPKDFFSII